MFLPLGAATKIRNITQRQSTHHNLKRAGKRFSNFELLRDGQDGDEDIEEVYGDEEYESELDQSEEEQDMEQLEEESDDENESPPITPPEKANAELGSYAKHNDNPARNTTVAAAGFIRAMRASRMVLPSSFSMGFLASSMVLSFCSMLWLIITSGLLLAKKHLRLYGLVQLILSGGILLA